MSNKKKAVVLSSGGLDSTTVLAIARDDGYEVYSLSFRYGQRHAVELEAAQRVADELGSGMRNMMKYGKAYGSEDPEMVEGDVFRIIVKVPEFGTAARAATGRIPGEEGTRSAPSRHQVEILLNCQKEQAIGDLMKIADRSDRTKFRNQVSSFNPRGKEDLKWSTIARKPRYSE